MTHWIRRHGRILVVVGFAAIAAAAVVGQHARHPAAIAVWSVVAAAAMLCALAPMFADARRKPIPALVGGPAIALFAMVVRTQVWHPVGVTACVVAAALGALGPVAVLLTRERGEDE